MCIYKHTKYVVRPKSILPMIEFVSAPFVQALPDIVHAQDEAVSGLESPETSHAGASAALHVTVPILFGSILALWPRARHQRHLSTTLVGLAMRCLKPFEFPFIVLQCDLHTSTGSHHYVNMFVTL